ncbi:MAG: MFS transporter [Neisseriaceae bacterium]|nr:MFS transporter [Neisseriaceae bacterium]MBP6861063.1 MFS transporter [Neisseriaceae bacterium]
MPLVVYILGLAIFALTTSEFMVAGMMPSLIMAFGVTVTEIGYLISLYALGMVVGGPILTIGLLKLRVPNKHGLLGLLAIYVLSQVTSALANDYTVMALSRVVAGVAASACFGIALAMSAEMVAFQARGRAASIVVSGLMLATVVGVPMATMIDQYFGWRESFWVVAVLAAVCAVIIGLTVSSSGKQNAVSLGQELKEFKKWPLWAAYATSGLVLGATFAAFSYLYPILTEVARFEAATMPLLFGLYGVASVVGNLIVGRFFADRYTIAVVVGGLSVLSFSLLLFALFGDSQTVSVVALVLIGLAGLPMNPAMITRVMNVAHPGPLVNTVHTSVINIGLGLGSWLGGIGIAWGYGVRSPLWVGLVLAVLGLASVLPFLKKANYPH